MTDPYPINAIVRDQNDPRIPVLLGVRCDGDDFCPADFRADILIHQDDDRATRLGYILDVAAQNGWTVLGRNNPEAALTYCPDHKAEAEALA